jgi:hypothetical protein
METMDDLTFDDRDSAPFMPKCVVVDPTFEWSEARNHRRIPWDDTIVYEMHVRGFTKQFPKIKKELQGTYAGLGQKEVVDYIRSHRYSRWIPWSRRWEFSRRQKLTLAISRTTRHNRSADRNGAQRTPVSGAVPPSLLPISEGGTGTYRTFDGAKRAFSIESSHTDLLNPQGVSSRTLPSAADPPTLNRSRTLLR